MTPRPAAPPSLSADLSDKENHQGRRLTGRDLRRHLMVNFLTISKCPSRPHDLNKQPLLHFSLPCLSLLEFGQEDCASHRRARIALRIDPASIWSGKFCPEFGLRRRCCDWREDLWCLQIASEEMQWSICLFFVELGFWQMRGVFWNETMGRSGKNLRIVY